MVTLDERIIIVHCYYRIDMVTLVHTQTLTMSVTQTHTGDFLPFIGCMQRTRLITTEKLTFNKRST